MNVVRQLALVAALLGVGAAGYIYGAPLLSAEDAGPQRERDGNAPKVIAEAVRMEPERTTIEAVGTAEASRSATLHPSVAGQVVAVNFTPGQAVDKGDVLLELEHRSEDLAVQLAEVRVRNARQLMQRYERTAGSGAVPASTVDEARTALEAARIELQQAQVALDERRVVAPFAGHVNAAAVEVGDRIGPDQAITTLDDRRDLLVRFAIPEAFLDRVSVGRTVSVSPGLTGGRSVSGEIIDLSSRIDPVTRSFQARARVDNSADQWRPGMSFAVRLDLLGQTYALVPEVSVQWGGDGPYLWVIRGGKAQRVGVRIIQRRKGLAMVDGALEDGEPVVVEGIQRMREGMDVAYAPPALPAGS